MKKIALLGMTILSFGVLTACSSNDTKNTSTSSSAKRTETSKSKSSSSSSSSSNTMKSSSTQLQTSESEQVYPNNQTAQEVESTTSEPQPVEEQSTETPAIKDQVNTSKKEAQSPEVETDNTTNMSTTPSKQMEEQENQRKLEAGKQKVRDYFSELNKTNNNKYPLDKVEHSIQDLFQFVNFNRPDMGTPDEQINLRVEQTINSILNGSW